MQQEIPLDELYRELIIEHYRNPHNKRALSHADVRCEGLNPLCGDEVVLELRFEEGRIAESGFSGRGCAISQASASMMTDTICDRSPAEVDGLIGACERMLKSGEAPGPELGDLEVLQGVARFPVRVKCALLPWKVLREGLDEYEESLAAREQRAT